MQIEHKIEKGTLCFFLSPSEADRFKFFNDEEPYLSYFIGAETFRKRFQKGFKLIGLTSEVTEEQCKMMVDELVIIQRGNNIIIYKSYTEPNYNKHFKSSLDSFKSLMNFLQVYQVNPYDETNILPEAEYYLKVKARCGKWIVLFKPND